jgi:predicted dehydrogenase
MKGVFNFHFMLRLGFIGVGGYAKSHLEGFGKLAQTGGVRITALADPGENALREAVLRPECAGALAFTDYRELLRCVPLDAVIISVPIHLHETIAFDALQHGVFVLLEKPAVPTMSQLEKLVLADTGNRVMVGFQHLYSSGMKKACEILRSGALGRLLSLRSCGVWPRGNHYYQRSDWAGKIYHHGLPVFDGPCTNAFAHFINNLCHLAGSPPLTAGGKLFRARRIESYDTGLVYGAFASGAKLYAAFSHAGERQLDVITEIRGESGSLHIENNGLCLVDQFGVASASDDGRQAMREHFLRLLNGEVQANLSPLASTRAYTFVTGELMKSSIYDFSSVKHVARPDNDDLYVVDDIDKILMSALDGVVPW